MWDALSVNRVARDVLKDVAEAVNRTIPATPPWSASLICATGSDGSYPTTAQAVYVCIPQEIDADSTEGATASFAGDSDNKVYAVNTGTSVPPQGTFVVVHNVGGVFTFRYDG